jgi:hypothetical protein
MSVGDGGYLKGGKSLIDVEAAKNPNVLKQEVTRPTNPRALEPLVAGKETVSDYRERVGRPITLDPKPSNPKDIIGSDKLPVSLVPDTAIAYATLGHLEGMLKYGLVNWRECGVRTSIYLDALGRHIAKFKNGEWEDPTTGVPHLGSALACINIIIDAYECGKLVDDRPKSAPVASLIDRFTAKVVHLKTLFKDHHPHHYTIGDK